MIEEMKKDGWVIYSKEDWTRKGYGKQRNSNIDIVIYQGFE